MTSKRWAAVSAIGLVAAVLFLLWPMDCIGKAGAGMHPIDFWKDCRTPLGYHVSWPYNSASSEPGVFSFKPGPTTPNRPPLILAAIIAGLVGWTAGYLVAEWRRDRFESFLTSDL